MLKSSKRVESNRMNTASTDDNHTEGEGSIYLPTPMTSQEAWSEDYHWLLTIAATPFWILSPESRDLSTSSTCSLKFNRPAALSACYRLNLFAWINTFVFCSAEPSLDFQTKKEDLKFFIDSKRQLGVDCSIKLRRFTSPRSSRLWSKWMTYS